MLEEDEQTVLQSEGQTRRNAKSLKMLPLKYKRSEQEQAAPEENDDDETFNSRGTLFRENV